ncbi:MAG TPA: patatin-like phospholipase family protein [Thermoanaerobaculia bacterium]|jgi:NTE family protein|nr:patatin-like phospholipase family protein [Thermoanaerobaculia bacterium]
MTNLTEPVVAKAEELPDEDRAPDGPGEGTALCISGGGYRAMLFHLGTLWALSEFGWLPRLDRVSSVSGGSITAAVLGLHWNELTFSGSRATNFEGVIVAEVRKLAGITIDAESIIKGIFLPGTISDRVVAAYDKHLYHGKTLQDLPDRPRFVLNATNVQSTALFRFSKPYIWDYRVGKIEQPRIRLAEAVGASSAFPPILSPMQLDLSRQTFVPGSGIDLQKPPYTRKAILTDGGVYDNMGIETAWKRYRRVLVSDAGGKTQAEEAPGTNAVTHSLRVNSLIDNQVRSLRKRQVIDSFKNGSRQGSFWSIRTDIRDYKLADALPCPLDRTLALAAVSTRLAALSAEVQEKLINLGWAMTDAAMRRHVDPALPPLGRFPYPRGI